MERENKKKPIEFCPSGQKNTIKAQERRHIAFPLSLLYPLFIRLLLLLRYPYGVSIKMF